jgi:hypothetical protein
MTIQILIEPVVTDITANPSVTTVVAQTAIATLTSDQIFVTPYNTITETTLQGALEQLADQSFRSNTTPTGDNIEEGDTWYDTSTEQFYVYRETSPALFEWVPIMVGNDSPDSDTVDAGAF